MEEEEPVRDGEEDMEVDVDKCTECDSNDWTKLSDPPKQDYINLASKLGKMINKNMYDDSVQILKPYKTCERTQGEWLRDRYPLLLAFLSACTGVDLDDPQPAVS